MIHWEQTTPATVYDYPEPFYNSALIQAICSRFQVMSECKLQDPPPFCLSLGIQRPHITLVLDIGQM